MRWFVLRIIVYSAIATDSGNSGAILLESSSIAGIRGLPGSGHQDVLFNPQDFQGREISCLQADPQLLRSDHSPKSRVIHYPFGFSPGNDICKCKCIRLRGGRGRTADEPAASTRAGAGGSGLAPRMFSRKRKRGPDTHAMDAERLRFDERFRDAGGSDLSALQAEEANLYGRGPFDMPPDESPPPPDPESDDRSPPAPSRPSARDDSDDAVAAAAAPWAREEGEEEGPPVRIGPVTFSYDHAEAAARLEAEERRRHAAPPPPPSPSPTPLPLSLSVALASRTDP